MRKRESERERELNEGRIHCKERIWLYGTVLSEQAILRFVVPVSGVVRRDGIWYLILWILPGRSCFRCFLFLCCPGSCERILFKPLGGTEREKLRLKMGIKERRCFWTTAFFNTLPMWSAWWLSVSFRSWRRWSKARYDTRKRTPIYPEFWTDFLWLGRMLGGPSILKTSNAVREHFEEATARPKKDKISNRMKSSPAMKTVYTIFLY